MITLRTSIHKRSRLLTPFVAHVVAVLLIVPLAVSGTFAVEATSDSQVAPISGNLVTDTSWDEPVVGTSATTIEDNASLAKRVDELERYIYEQQQVKIAAAEEALPGPAKEKAAATDECTPKKIDVIVKPTFTPLGRIYVDGVTYDDDDATKSFFNTDRDVEFGLRQFRIGGRGYIYENLFYNAEFEIRGTNSAITYKDIYIEQQQIPGIGRIRAGHFKEPIGLEEFGSDLFQSFMDKSPTTHSFAPGRNFGVMAWNTFDECQDASWFAGVFRADSPDSPTDTGLWRSDNDDWSFDTRLACLPFYDEPSGGRYLVHLGGSYSFRHIGGLTTGATGNQNAAYSTLNGLAEFTTRSWVGSRGPIGFGTEADTNEWNQLDAEFLVIWGSASVQADYYQLLMNSGEQFNGTYTFFSYFLTGENRAYRKDNKTIDRTQPLEPFFWVDTCRGAGCGRGAWEVLAGYSFVNLDDGHDIVVTNPATAANRRRGFNNNFVVGVNWYQNPWARMMFDYTFETVNFVDAGVPDSNASIFGIRWQVDW